jgi:hypothetical protein
VVQNTFSPQNVQNTTTQLSTPPVKVNRKGLANMTSQFKSKHKAYIKDATDKTIKKQREAEVKADRKVAANIVKAMKSGLGKKPSAKQLDKLETACKDGIDFYNDSFKDSIKYHQEQMVQIREDMQNREDLANYEKKPFDRTPFEERIKAEKEGLSNLVKGSEADRFAMTIDTLLETQLRKNEKLGADLREAIKTAETSKTEANVAKVKDLATQYRKIFTQHATEYEKLPGRDRPQAIVQQEKMIDDMLYGADASLFSLKQARLGPPPWDQSKQSEGNDLVEKGRELQAQDLLKTGTVDKPKGGSSEVLVLKKGQTTQFAFKSVNGESSQMKIPKGGGAIREAISSKVAESVLQQTGLDFGFPKVSIATLEGKVGCLIEGINGREVPPPDKDPDKVGTAKFQNALPGKELQKTICAGLATGNIFDMKWDNVFWEGEGAQAKARPFDAGAAFLPSGEINYLMHGRVGKPGFDVPLLLDAQGNTVQGAKEPMDAEIVEAMLKIDVNAIEKVIDEELQRNASTGLDKCLDVDSKKNGLKCLTVLQNVLLAHKDDIPAPSLETVMGEVQTEIVKAFPPPPGTKK